MGQEALVGVPAVVVEAEMAVEEAEVRMLVGVVLHLLSVLQEMKI